MISITNRKAIVSGFDDSLNIGEKNIGSGVAAFDKPDGTTILLLVNEGIDHTEQPNTMLSLNQLRHFGLDVCDVHPKFKSGNRPGLFRIKAGEHDIPFHMDNGLAALSLRYPTDDELRECEVVTLTSNAHWDPAILDGDNFTPNKDSHVTRKLQQAADARNNHRYPTRSTARSKNRWGFCNVSLHRMLPLQIYFKTVRYLACPLLPKVVTSPVSREVHLNF